MSSKLLTEALSITSKRGCPSHAIWIKDHIYCLVWFNKKLFYTSLIVDANSILWRLMACLVRQMVEVFGTVCRSNHMENGIIAIVTNLYFVETHNIQHLFPLFLFHVGLSVHQTAVTQHNEPPGAQWGNLHKTLFKLYLCTHQILLKGYGLLLVIITHV